MPTGRSFPETHFFFLSSLLPDNSSLSLSLLICSLTSVLVSLSHVCVGVGEQKKGRIKDEGGEERDVRETREKKRKKEKGKERGRGLLHVFGRREGIRHL
jgi:hypothetical protein